MDEPLHRTYIFLSISLSPSQLFCIIKVLFVWRKFVIQFANCRPSYGCLAKITFLIWGLSCLLALPRSTFILVLTMNTGVKIGGNEVHPIFIQFWGTGWLWQCIVIISLCNGQRHQVTRPSCEPLVNSLVNITSLKIRTNMRYRKYLRKVGSVDCGTSWMGA